MKRSVSQAGGREDAGRSTSTAAPFRELLAQPHVPVGAQAQVEPWKGHLKSMDRFAQYEIGDSSRHAEPQNAGRVDPLLGHRNQISTACKIDKACPKGPETQGGLELAHQRQRL
jgi:hypothetical protein